MKALTIALTLGLLLGANAADLQFAPSLSAGMVVQRDKPITVDGQGEPGTSVRVSLGPQTTRAEVDDSGHWSTTLNPLPGGGPFTLSAYSADTERQIGGILVGDVWLFSGQSNMQMALDEAEGGPAKIGSVSPDTRIRLLSVPKGAADKPATGTGATWQSCAPESLRKVSAVAWFFAKHLRRDPALTEIPPGLIDSSFGGTAEIRWSIAPR